MSDSASQWTTDDLALLEQAGAAAARMRAEIAKVIVGQEATVNALLTAILAQGHTLVIGVPGLAKTLLVKTIAQVLGWSFKRIQFTPDMMPADIIGMELLQIDPESGRRSMQFIPGPLFAQIVLADEINRTPPKTQAALLEAMQEYTVTSMGHARLAASVPGVRHAESDRARHYPLQAFSTLHVQPVDGLSFGRGRRGRVLATTEDASRRCRASRWKSFKAISVWCGGCRCRM